MSPLQALRIFLETDPTLHSASTQAGFARLVGRSEVLIRSIEKGRSSMSRKFARKVSQLIGVNEEWLMKQTVTGKGIPSTEGGKLTHFEVIQAIGLKATEPVIGNAKLNPIVHDVVNHQLIEGILGMVKAEFTDFCENACRNASDPFIEILDWLKKRAEDRGNLRGFETQGGISRPRKRD